MNNCPSCNEKPISIGAWCNGINSIKCKCKRCDADLIANVATWLSLLATILAMCITAYISITHFDVHFKQDRLLLLGLITVPVLIGSLIGYFLGGYKVKAC